VGSPGPREAAAGCRPQSGPVVRRGEKRCSKEMCIRDRFRFLLPAGALLLAMGAAIPARAQAPAPEDLSRGVARIGLMDGEVSVRRGDSGEWVAGVINAPLMTDDRVATGQNSRAEVQFDSANVLRIGGNAEIQVLENGRYHIEIARGTVTYRIVRQSQACLLYTSIPAFFNTDVRFMIPALPFFALALGLAMQNSRWILPIVALFQAFLCWPAVMDAYCDPNAWRVRGFQLRAGSPYIASQMCIRDSPRYSDSA